MSNAPMVEAVAGDLVTTTDLAHELRISTKTLKKWIASGKLPTPTRLSVHTSVWARPVIEKALADMRRAE